MVVLLVVLLLVVPIIELAFFILVADHVGIVAAAALVIACSIGGGWLVKREGLGVWRKARVKLQAGEMPAVELLNGLLVLAAGVLMAVPGFVTDVVGLLLLVPPVRALVRSVVFRRFESQLLAMVDTPAAAGFGASPQARVQTGPATYGVVDVHEIERDNRNTDRDR